MSLQRRNTRFGLSALRGTTPDSDGNEKNDTESLLAPDNDSSNKLKKRGWASPDKPPSKIRRESEHRDQEDSRSGLNRLHTPQAVQSKVSTIGNVRIKHSSPWESLTKVFYLMLEDSVMIASQKDGRFVAVKEFSGRDADRKINMLQLIQHENVPNFLAFLDCFSFEGIRYAVFEHEINEREKLPVTLRQYALITPFITEQQLATILGQILHGLKYLALKGLEHGAITCQNILIGTNGSVRITGQECCREIVSSRVSIRDIKGVGYVTMELMDKNVTNDGPIKVHDIRRWPLTAVNFLSMIESVYSINELIEHPLLSSCEWRELERGIVLKANVYISEFSVFRGYRLLPQDKQ